MRMIALATAALMSSAAALAQTADASKTTDTATAESQAASPSASAMKSTGATASATMMTPTSAGDWAAHDLNKDGALSPLEFAHHMAAMNGNGSTAGEARRERYSRASGNGAIKLLNASAADFSQADKNMDKRVDGSELATMGSGGAAGATTATPIAAGAGSMSRAPTTSDSAATPSAPATGKGRATSGSSISTDMPSDDMSDDMQNSTDPNESTTTPPTA